MNRLRWLTRAVDARGGAARAAVHARLGAVLDTLGHPVGEDSTYYLLEALGEVSGLGSLWLDLAVLTGELPDDAAVQRLRRTWDLPPLLLPLLRGPWAAVTVVTDEVLVDVTAATPFALELVEQWEQQHALRRVTWVGATLQSDGEVVVPWTCRLVLPDPALDAAALPAGRTRRLAALLERSGNAGSLLLRGGAPLSAADQVPPGDPGRFAALLAAAAHADRVVTLSAAGATELRGWRAMLGGAGLTGPEVLQVAPPDEPAASPAWGPALLCTDDGPATDHADVLAACALLGLPVTLVGADEPLPPGAGLVHLAPADGLAVPVARALAAQLPVLTYRHGAAAERVARQGRGLLVERGDAAGLLEGLRLLAAGDVPASTRVPEQVSWPEAAEQLWQALVPGQPQARS